MKTKPARCDPMHVIALVAGLCLPHSAEAIELGFLAADDAWEKIGPHNRAAWNTAEQFGSATLLLRQPNGSFADRSGKVHDLDEFDVLWYHQGDAIRRNALYRGPSLAAIRRFAESGRGLLLSGGALALVAQFRLETEIRPQRHDRTNHRDPAGMRPFETSHPIFSGFEPDDDGLIWLGRGGCRAVADFDWGGPAKGMILANTPSGQEHPLVEYRLGSGHVIVFGWHWPDYADLKNPHRDHLLQLTHQMIDYLADPSRWRDVIVRSDFPPVASTETPGVSPQRWRALQMAIDDLSARFGERYPLGNTYRTRLETLHAEHDRLIPTDDRNALASVITRFERLQREALLANPLLDFERLLLIRRRAERLGLPTNFNGNTDLEPAGYENSLVMLSPHDPNGTLETLFTPEGDRFVGDVDLDYDAERLLFSMPDANGRWGVAELELSTRRLKRLPLIDEPDVHNYDACYLPDGRIVFTSTAPFIGVPCVGGRSKVANLYLRERDGRIRRLTNDQDHNWCPTVLNNGRILYQRWEYADIAHAFTRLLFTANPDGSRQSAYYGSNSFWPTAMFFARPIPGHPTQVVTVVGGHHDAPRQGDLIVLDPALGRHEASGVVQRIPGWGKNVEPVVLDGLIGARWPRFLHPYPLSENYFLVACKPTPESLWGIYLVDRFDNFVLIHEEPGRAMLEPIPLCVRRPPPVIPDTADPNRRDASVLMLDVYQGGGLEGVRRGTVKRLRLLSYEFTFHGFGGEPDRVGMDGPWDVKRILGTVPVEPDGSAHFRVPANTPIAIQPLDDEGKALALMRSWCTAAPGEVLSCVGCHESQNTTPPFQSAPSAALREAMPITPWHGPPRGFSFVREVQPVLDAYCVRCHHGRPLEIEPATFDLTARPTEQIPSAFQMRFTPSYMALRRWVHTPTLESDAHLLSPRDFHADTSRLVQILRDGHQGVRLDDEAWDRLITWIDLNAPAHGTWREVVGHIPAKERLIAPGVARRRELHRRYSGIDEDPEAVYPTAVMSQLSDGPQLPDSLPTAPLLKRVGRETRSQPGTVSTDPEPSKPEIMSIEIDQGIELELVRIMPGRFVMGSENGYPNERPAHPVEIDTPFWIGRFEVTNREYACFDPTHASGLETGEQYAFGNYERGPPLDRPDQPVVRISWEKSRAFCRWLSRKSGQPFDLPTESQWEYACRAGTDSPMEYGSLDDNFSHWANLSDATHHRVDYPHVPNALPPWRPADTRFDDGWRVSSPVGTFRPNGWGLYDMHGNVAEWTRSDYGPYQGIPKEVTHRKTVRGGSWLDRPQRARSAMRLHYDASQAVHNVGFRIICKDQP